MNILVLHSSPRKSGNTAALVDIFVNEVKKNGVSSTTLNLYEMKLNSCCACRECQKDWDLPNCVQNDDMEIVFSAVLKADIIIFASPIYSFYCTPPLKATMDRLVYALNKYYGDKCGPSLWKGKKVGIITTCGYSIEVGTDLWEEGVKRFCKHSQLEYIGMLSQRHKSYKEPFLTPQIEVDTMNFAQKIISL